MKFRFAIVIVLALCTEGHVGRIHKKTVDLDALVGMSSHIIMAAKSEPFASIVKMPLDSTKRYKPFESRRWSYEVLEVLKGPSSRITAGSVISVRPAHDDMFFQLTQRAELEGISKSPILATYEGGTPNAAKSDTVILFLGSRNDETGTYQISAYGAIEAPSAKPSIQACLAKPGPKRL